MRIAYSDFAPRNVTLESRLQWLSPSQCPLPLCQTRRPPLQKSTTSFKTMSGTMKLETTDSDTPVLVVWLHQATSIQVQHLATPTIALHGTSNKAHRDRSPCCCGVTRKAPNPRTMPW
ncbi:hypothetical protein H310_05729 [Aphanomyces invadans]|uniref:Uncharacterized protein n=1 Tax=Aphanomyces invadans TaxID=157072 RepID=A0A024U8D1_9STRA|nr:hypothetical protein H310_05729 [Aphanomyces invadans]ETW02157.1 hypothetical protein H310_05729 [Aphanomyces invadans]|eukprot:XP_008868762.1 hypothetical protein H310_05729 [Aphanomyces invadans]